MFLVGFFSSAPMTPTLPLLSGIVSAKRSRSFAAVYSISTLSTSIAGFIGLFRVHYSQIMHCKSACHVP
jgi:hypothetical protein